MLVFLKRCCLHSTTGIILGLLALFLMADTFYLNTVRDQKAEKLETAEQALDTYQVSLQSGGNPESLKPYLQHFHSGRFLKSALASFQEAHSALQITEIHVEQTESLRAKETTFPRSSQKKKPHPEIRLTLRGQIRSDVKTEAPYQQLNEILSTIGQETGCSLQLFKGGETASAETSPSMPEKDPFQFELHLEPEQQKHCWQRYTQAEVDS